MDAGVHIEIYADVVFLINFIMNYLIFWVVSKLTKRRCSWWRLGLGAAVASGLYCILIFVAPFRVFVNIFSALVIVMAAIAVTFRPASVKDFLKLIGLTYISAFSIGGAGIGLFYFTNISDVIGNMLSVGVNNFSFTMLLVLSCTTYIALKLGLPLFRRTLIKRQMFCNVKVSVAQEAFSLNGLVDTGNSLTDPLSKNPVIVAEFDGIKNILPEALRAIFYEDKENDILSVVANINDANLHRRIRMIPFTSLGKQNGMLIGFKPDFVEISDDAKSIILKDVVIGIYNYSLSKDGTYNALLGPELLQVNEG